MGIFGTIGNIVTFPFKLIFGKRKDAENLPPPAEDYLQNPTLPPVDNYPMTDPNLENVRAKMDLVMTQIDNLKLEYETLNQRMQNIERMVKEIYAMAKS